MSAAPARAQAGAPPPLQVLHTRSFTGVGMQFLQLLSAFYLVYSLDAASVSAALSTMPPIAAATPGAAHTSSGTPCLHANAHTQSMHD